MSIGNIVSVSVWILCMFVVGIGGKNEIGGWENCCSVLDSRGGTTGVVQLKQLAYGIALCVGG